MTLTMQQKEDLLLQYDLLIWNVVHRFRRRYGSFWDNRQDLYQEAVLAFFQYVDKLQPGKDIFIFPFRAIVHALCQYSLRDQVVTVPHQRTSDYRNRINSLPGTADYEELDTSASVRRMTTDDLVEKVYLDQFVDTLEPMDRQIVCMKMAGMRNREVARALGVTDLKVHRQLSRMGRAYQAA